MTNHVDTLTQDSVQCIPAETPIEEEVMDEEGEHRNPNRFELLSHPFLFNKYPRQ